MNRRQLLVQTGVALAVPSMGLPGKAATFDQPILAAFHDSQFLGSRAFAAALRGQQVSVFDTRVNLLQLWHGSNALQAQLISRGVIAGLTTYSDFLVLQSLAREQRLGLLYQLSVESQRVWRRVDRLSARPGAAKFVKDFDTLVAGPQGAGSRSAVSLTAFLLGRLPSH